MAEAKSVPVLFLSDSIVLPGMVVPIELDDAASAAVDAAKASESGELLIAPRLEDRYASYGVIATIDRVGRFSGGSPAAVLKAGSRGRIGSGVTGPGAALWVEVEAVEDSETSAEAAMRAGSSCGCPETMGHCGSSSTAPSPSRICSCAVQ